MSHPEPTRRAVLAAATAGLAAWGAAAVTGCATTRSAASSGGSTATGGPLAGGPATGGVMPRSVVQRERASRNRLAVGSLLLIARYRATVARHPSLADRLTPIVDDHRAHLAALTGVRIPGKPDARAPVPGESTAGVRVPRTRSGAVRDLIRAEATAAEHRRHLLDSAETPGFAALLAALVASHTTHLQALRAGGRPIDVTPAPGGRLPRGPVAQGTIDALQEALAAEHAAVFGYGELGAWLSGNELERAHAGHDAHRRRRDRLEQVVRSVGAEPAAAAAGYRLPFALAGDEDARRLAGNIEDGVANAYGWLVAATGPGDPLRQDAAGWLTEAAVRQASWNGRCRALPGLPVRS